MLKTIPVTAFWVTSWPFAEYVQHEWAGAWVNSAFRREAGPLASDLIRAAVSATRAYFGNPPELGIVTMIDPTKVRAKRDPGYCYLAAGFTRVGKTKSGLDVLQMLPAAMPDARDALTSLEAAAI